MNHNNSPVAMSPTEITSPKSEPKKKGGCWCKVNSIAFLCSVCFLIAAVALLFLRVINPEVDRINAFGSAIEGAVKQQVSYDSKMSTTENFQLIISSRYWEEPEQENEEEIVRTSDEAEAEATSDESNPTEDTETKPEAVDGSDDAVVTETETGET